MPTNYLLARNQQTACDIVRLLKWVRLPQDTVRLPIFRTPKGKIVQYSTCENLQGRDMKGAIIFLAWAWERNSMARPDILDWAASRGAKFVRLYDDESCDQCVGRGCHFCNDTGKVEY